MITISISIDDALEEEKWWIFTLKSPIYIKCVTPGRVVKHILFDINKKFKISDDLLFLPEFKYPLVISSEDKQLLLDNKDFG
jgi:hypothetical protein